THLHRAGGGLEKWRLVKIDPPLRLGGAVTDVYPDGWMGPFSSYTRYATENNWAGHMRVVLSGPPQGAHETIGHATVAIGPIVIGDDNQPHLGKPTELRRFDLRSKRQRILTFRAPGPRFRVEVTITPTFVPKELSSDQSDNRHLGAQVRYVFLPPLKAAQK
ncbi:MAG: hypothetical protein V7645_298, partial [Actinomycetota bacterium]